MIELNSFSVGGMHRGLKTECRGYHVSNACIPLAYRSRASCMDGGCLPYPIHVATHTMNCFHQKKAVIPRTEGGVRGCARIPGLGVPCRENRQIANCYAGAGAGWGGWRWRLQCAWHERQCAVKPLRWLATHAPRTVHTHALSRLRGSVKLPHRRVRGANI